MLHDKMTTEDSDFSKMIGKMGITIYIGKGGGCV